MKRLSLDETWVECLKMTKWLSENYDAEIDDIDERKIYYLACVCHMDGDDFPALQCFFCNYTNGYSGCKKSCPGKLVDPAFSCTLGKGPHYISDPIGFHENLLRLNAIRLGKALVGTEQHTWRNLWGLI